MPLLIVLFTLIPALELYLLFKIGAQIGGFNTILIIILTGVIGASLSKSQGLAILAKIQNEFAGGKMPGNQIIQGLMVFAGGLLLLTPGFMTDIIGFSFVLPGTRHLLMHGVRKLVIKGLKNGNIHFQTFGQGQYHSYGHRPQDQQVKPGVFEAEYEEKKDEE
ncbi:MAG: membrane protein FxsA [Halobacteriovoraceae bacterium]|nr:membrane protein FxsA [Halobacteriovoraceae bacterium]|tara:strand:- start:2758 stop:3246 length:489 start_codon:yes stop_codon:yes gene_type:complete